MTDEEILKAFKNKRNEEICKSVIRPKFRLYKETLQIVAFAVVILLTIVFFKELETGVYLTMIFALILAFLLTQTKNILFLMIFFYQKFAPKTVRAACLFTPCCSEYMRISIEKYGVFSGVKKGFIRLSKCHPPNGGLDKP